MFTNSTSEQALLGKDFYLVIELDIFGTILRAASDYVRPVSSSSGEEVSIDIVLANSPTVTLSEGWAQPENEPGLLELTIALQGVAKDYWASGLLDKARISVFMWPKDADWDSKELLLVGSVKNSSDDGSIGRLKLTVEQERGGSGEQLPFALFPSDTSFADNMARAGTSYMPFCFGKTNTIQYPATLHPFPFKALYLTGSQSGDHPNITSLLLGSDRFSTSEVELTGDDPEYSLGGYLSVAIDNTRYGDSAPFVLLDTDELMAYSEYVADLDSLLGRKYGTNFYWRAVDDYTGNHLGQPIRGLGDLCVALLDYSGEALDYGKMTGFRGALNTYPVCGQILDPVGTIDYIRDEILSCFPVTLMSSPRGLYVKPWVTSVSANEALLTLNPEQGNCSRESAVLRDGDEVINAVITEAGYCRFREVYSLSMKMTSSDLGSFRVGSPGDSTICTASENQFGYKALELTNNLLYYPWAISLVMQQIVLAKAFPRPRVSYSLDNNLAWLRPGAVVNVFDAEVRLSGRAIIDKCDISESGMVVELVVIEELPDNFEEKASVISPF